MVNDDAQAIVWQKERMRHGSIAHRYIQVACMSHGRGVYSHYDIYRNLSVTLWEF